MKKIEESPLFENPGEQGVGVLPVEPAEIVQTGYMSAQQKLEHKRALLINLAPRDPNILPSSAEALRRKPEWAEQFRLQRP